MINRQAIVQWRTNAPWNKSEQVEQDLIICRALVAIFSDEFLASELAFRGGTALHKLYISPQARYSEDIDLVQINAGPIKSIMQRLGEVLDFLPNKITKVKKHNNTMVFRMESEIPPIMPIRLKVEINCKEHFNVLGLVKMPFKVDSSWFKGECEITTYELDELMGTKLRALYQRKKGRDLFDMYRAMSQDLNPERVMQCYRRYMDFVVDTPPTRKQYLRNMEEKMADSEFVGDIAQLIRTDEVCVFDAQEAYEAVREVFIDKLKK
ncbi:MAG: nucleotidyl transferase AbiEii/AbiGii toxin family protein [Rikenellaceae bacterium]